MAERVGFDIKLYLVDIIIFNINFLPKCPLMCPQDLWTQADLSGRKQSSKRTATLIANHLLNGV